MSEFKEFQGKSLDMAIEEACRHFDLDRGKLELEIISGGSSGIFGLVGVKKAVVKARPRPDFRKNLDSRQGPEAPAAEEGEGGSARQPRNQARGRDRGPSRPEAQPESRPEPHKEAVPAPAPQAKPEPKPEPKPAARDLPAAEQELRPAAAAPAPAPHAVPEAPAPADEAEEHDHGPDLGLAAEAELEEEDLPASETLSLDPQLVEDTVREVLNQVLAPIVQNPVLTFSREGGRVDVFIDDEENSGLIIGREGQTLAAIQYLVNRIVCRRLEAAVRVQIDTGDYRERQNDGLRRLAISLADRAKRFGRPQSTKLLSSYHRRVVHMALQNDGQVQTRSKGEGPMKKVLILPKRRGPQRPERRDEPRA